MVEYGDDSYEEGQSTHIHTRQRKMRLEEWRVVRDTIVLGSFNSRHGRIEPQR